MNHGRPTEGPDPLAERLAKVQTELDILYQFGLVIHAPRDWLPLYRLLYDQAERAMPIDAAFIAFLVEDETKFQSVISIDQGLEYPLQPAWGFNKFGPSAWIIEHAAPVRFNDLDPEIPIRFPQLPWEVAADSDDFGDETKISRGWMTVPMLINREVKGIINVQSYQYGVYGEREERLLMTLGSMLAIAVNQSQLINRFEAMREALSAPLIPVSVQLTILPLIGQLDSARMALVQRRLLATVEQQRVRHVILDLTGLTDMRSEIQRFLVQLIQTVALLGATCTLSGVYPGLARAFALSGGDLSGIQMVRDVEQGLIRFGALPGSKPR